jgi:hypothetical protein
MFPLSDRVDDPATAEDSPATPKKEG